MFGYFRIQLWQPSRTAVVISSLQQCLGSEQLRPVWHGATRDGPHPEMHPDLLEPELADSGGSLRHETSESCCLAKLLKARRGEDEASAHYKAQHP